MVYAFKVRRQVTSSTPRGRTIIGIRLFPPCACDDFEEFNHEVTVELRIRVPELSGEEVGKWSYVVLRDGREMAAGPLYSLPLLKIGHITQAAKEDHGSPMEKEVE